MMSVLHSTLGTFDESADMFPELGNFATLADGRAASEVLDAGLLKMAQNDTSPPPQPLWGR